MKEEAKPYLGTRKSETSYRCFFPPKGTTYETLASRYTNAKIYFVTSLAIMLINQHYILQLQWTNALKELKSTLNFKWGIPLQALWLPACMVNNSISTHTLKHNIYLMIKPHYSVLESEEVSRDHLIDS